METQMRKSASLGKKIAGRLVLVVILVAVFLLGFWWRGLFTPVSTAEVEIDTQEKAPAVKQKKTVWICSMHPHIRLFKPGVCNICNMDLVPVSDSDDGDTAEVRQLSVSENARKLMEVETVPVERKLVTATIRMVGKVDYDETRLAYITARVPGRLDRLFADYTGVPVKKGEHLVSIYSPELYSAQEELIRAFKMVKDVRENQSGNMREFAKDTLNAAREKLRLWGLSAQQISSVEKSGKVSDHMTIYAPTGGIVIQKNAVKDMYVEEGTRIYTIADMSQLWVKLDAYESDLEWLRYGQKVEFTTVSYPGEIFRGTISFMDPILNERTRTVKIRVNVANAEGKLKPEMFVKAMVRAQVAAAGKIMDADLAGKWICPMHPDIVKNKSGECDLCEMPLVTAESLGYVSDDPGRAEKPLVIPVTAALVTGKRAVVYVQLPGRDKPTFVGREIVLGPRAGDYYLVPRGLREGERVVVKGNFKIDSALQIMAKPSMMTPESGQRGSGHDHGVSGREKHRQDTVSQPAVDKEFREQLGKVYAQYFLLQQELARDRTDGAVNVIKQMLNALHAMNKKPESGELSQWWHNNRMELENILAEGAGKNEIKLIREKFYLLSQNLIQVSKRLGTDGDGPYYVMYCSMAFDNQGALWLQDNHDLRNPYFGAAMLKCGQVKEIIPAARIYNKHKGH